MCNMKRCIYPIGQGSFFSEVHYFDANEQIVIVYDCGSRNVAELENQLKYFPYKHIDYLIVSHFHEDHTNGIQKLIETGVSIGTLVVPKLSSVEKLIYICEKVDPEMIFSPGNYFSAERVVEVAEDGESSDEGIMLNSGISKLNHKCRAFIRDKTNWILKFYIDRTMFDKMSDLDQKLVDSITIDSIKDKEYISGMKGIYKKIGKSINMTSMSMYSGVYIKNIDYNRYHYHWQNSAILLNGDADLSNNTKIDKYIEHFKDERNLIANFGIPHHGSYHNMQRALTEFPIKHAYIQSGFINPFGHPAQTIINMHIAEKINVHIINENKKKKIIEY
jgi:hypothetical protein